MCHTCNVLIFSLLLMLVSKIEKHDSLVSPRRHAPLRVTLLLLGSEPLLRPLAYRFSSVRLHACVSVRVSGPNLVVCLSDILS